MTNVSELMRPWLPHQRWFGGKGRPIATVDPRGAEVLVAAEQSNTSIVYGEEFILKIFRRVAPGLNPDLELTRTLQDAGSTRVAPVRGWIQQGAGDEGTTLALLQEFVPSASEGWALAQ